MSLSKFGLPENGRFGALHLALGPWPHLMSIFIVYKDIFTLKSAISLLNKWKKFSTRLMVSKNKKYTLINLMFPVHKAWPFLIKQKILLQHIKRYNLTAIWAVSEWSSPLAHSNHIDRALDPRVINQVNILVYVFAFQCVHFHRFLFCLIFCASVSQPLFRGR